MRTYDEALELLRGLQVPARTETLPVEHALGAVLAADVAAASDQPPFDRATMDGIAVQPGERRAFRVVGSVMAGQRHEGGLAADEAVAIMTGAPVPGGCTVVPVEVVEREGEQARVSSDWDLGRVRNVACAGRMPVPGRPSCTRGRASPSPPWPRPPWPARARSRPGSRPGSAS